MSLSPLLNYGFLQGRNHAFWFTSISLESKIGTQEAPKCLLNFHQCVELMCEELRIKVSV